MHCALPRFHVISPSRRDFLARAATLATCFGRPGAASAEGANAADPLGTGGGPRSRKVSSAAAPVIVCRGKAYLIDCSDGVARQLVMADVPVRHNF
ncbi:MAG: hypothetical protein JWN34_5982 [Bryobacterales bacterium]|jgi:hypothetical protein|nr:hypothetical protein [Bryobacterales bacterium]